MAQGLLNSFRAAHPMLCHCHLSGKGEDEDLGTSLLSGHLSNMHLLGAWTGEAPGSDGSHG